MGNEKYHIRKRYIYALIFNNRHCYIGQSVDIARRLKQHQASGDWRGNGPFQQIALGSYNGTYAQLEDWEYAWRICAHKAGWHVYGGNNGSGAYCVNPMKRANNYRVSLSNQCTWPRQNNDFNTMKWIVLGVALLLCIWVLTKH